MAETALGSGVVCPLCGWRGHQFEPRGRLPRPNVMCPRCKGFERTRAMFLYLREETPILTTPARMLHVAPEAGLRSVFESVEGLDYITTDLEMPDVSVKASLEDLPFRDEFFDCVVCSHVLEHVGDDIAAMEEIQRVLRPDGSALIMVPIMAPIPNRPEPRTIEDPAIVTPEERERVYGQHDHVRAYGRDFPERARDAGFEVTVVRYADQLGADEAARFGLKAEEELFVCRPARRGFRFETTIAAADTMARADRPDEYFALGLAALRIVRQAVAAHAAAEPETILDAPSGYGRVLRMLRAAHPTASITACDVDPGAVAFCARKFGAEPRLVTADPDGFSLARKYDLIWSGSLLTRLPESVAVALIRGFESHLKPGGLLVFTTHGQTIAELLRRGGTSFALSEAARAALALRYASDGFAFEPSPDVKGGLDGVALASKAWVARVVGRRPSLELLSHQEAGWMGWQDAVVCRARPVNGASRRRHSPQRALVHRRRRQGGHDGPPLPPDRLRFMGETDEGFLAIGDQLADSLDAYAGLKRGSTVLDIGCGYGRLAHALLRRGFAGRYLGLDVLLPQVRWCSKQLGDERYEFRHLDLNNQRYNPNGKETVAALDLGEERFDVVSAFSLFTHMWPDDVSAYLCVIASALAPEGRALTTFFLLDDEWRRLASKGEVALSFAHRHGNHCRYESKEDPLHRVGYELDWVISMANEAGLTAVGDPVFGTWSWRPVHRASARGYQDALTFAPATSAEPRLKRARADKVAARRSSV